MERNGFPLTSGLFPLISNTGADLLTGAFPVSLPLLQVGMLGCVAMDVASPYQTPLGGGDLLWVFEPRLSLGRMSLLISLFL
jgi:hypothetical protein